MGERERNKSVPLYYWIKTYKGINNVKDDSKLKHQLTGNSIADQVLRKFVKINKVNPNQFSRVMKKAIERYRTANQHLYSEYKYFKDTHGKFVDYDDYDKGIMVLAKNEYDKEEVRVQR